MNQEQEIEIFLSYSHRDEQLAKELRAHLSPLKGQNPSVYIWSTDDILSGQPWEPAIREHLERARIILLLVSPALLSSKFASNELSRIEEKQKKGTAVVLPIILRPTDWSETFIANLRPLPANGKPLTKWQSRDLAYLEIIDGIKTAIENLKPPAQADDEKKRLRKILETFSERELFTLSFDLRLNIKALLEDTSVRSVNRLPKVSVDRLLQYMGEQDRIKELGGYIRKNRPASNYNMENL